MVVSFLVAIYFEIIYAGPLEPYQKMVIGVCITSVSWIGITFLTRPTELSVLTTFFKSIRPHSMGWQPVVRQLTAPESALLQEPGHSLSAEILMLFLGSIMIYLLLFGTGFLLYGEMLYGLICIMCAGLSALSISKIWK
jgi:hypothetical protein